MAEYIDKERLREVVHRNIAGGDSFDQLIDMQPTADVKPIVHAHWDVIDQGREGDECFVHVWETLRCSNCGMERETEDGYMPEYCEGCGAKMEGEE